MAYERITDDQKFDGKTRKSHEARYRIAAGFIETGDDVIDMCCGIGYGRSILTEQGSKYINWTGYDKNPIAGGDIVEFDLETASIPSKKELGQATKLSQHTHNVFVGLEAIEHLNDKGVENFLRIANYAQDYIIISTPVVPNSNPYHKQQFSRKDIQKLAKKHLTEFDEYMYLEQDDTNGIFIYKHK